MSALSTLHIAPPGFPSLPSYAAQWRAIRFELLPGTGEWITSHIALCDSDGFTVRQVIRPSVLRALFGSQAKHFQSLFEFVERSLEGYLAIGGNLADWSEPIEGVSATVARTAYARQGRLQALRMAARQSTALCALDDLDLHTEPTVIEDETRFWGNRIKDAVVSQRPELSPYFDKQGMLYTDSARFGFLTDSVAAHFANIAPTSVSQSMRMARGKLQELRIGARTMHLTLAKLIAGAARPDDITLSDTHIVASERAISELRQEAEEGGIVFVAAHTVPEAAAAIIEIA